jgi:two-component system nitrate/nitrite response regulator NarL
MTSNPLSVIPPDCTPTKREIEVLEKLAQGLTSKQIAQQLNITFKTVVTHRAHLLNKLDVHNTALLIRRAIALCACPLG